MLSAQQRENDKLDIVRGGVKWVIRDALFITFQGEGDSFCVLDILVPRPAVSLILVENWKDIIPLFDYIFYILFIFFLFFS